MTQINLPPPILPPKKPLFSSTLKVCRCSESLPFPFYFFFYSPPLLCSFVPCFIFILWVNFTHSLYYIYFPCFQVYFNQERLKLILGSSPAVRSLSTSPSERDWVYCLVLEMLPKEEVLSRGGEQFFYGIAILLSCSGATLAHRKIHSLR